MDWAEECLGKGHSEAGKGSLARSQAEDLEFIYFFPDNREPRFEDKKCFWTLWHYINSAVNSDLS